MHGFVYIVSLAWTEDFLKVLSLKMYKNKYFLWQRKVQLNSQSRFEGELRYKSIFAVN